MWEMIIDELTNAMHEFVAGFVHLLPRLLAMLIIALLGWVIAYILKVVVRGILRIARIDRLSENSGATQILSKAALPPSSELLSGFVFWVVWLGFLLLGINMLGIVALQEHVSRIFLYLPRLFAALFLIFLGLLAASFFSRATLLAAVNANFPSPRLLAHSIRIAIVAIAVSMVFEELGLAERTILVAFAIVFGASMLGLAIAFGFGGQELARQVLERLFLKAKQEKNQDELSPL
jgi:hypothetical protein